MTTPPTGPTEVPEEQRRREQELVDRVVRSFDGCEDPRLRFLMQSLVRHLHGFLREVRLTEAEWERAIAFLTDAGHITDERRQEFILLSDVLGVSMLVDAINNRRAIGATVSTLEGPFHIHGAPERDAGTSMADGAPGIPCFIVGTVKDTEGKPVAGAALDIWQTDGEGLYEAQRARFHRRIRGVPEPIRHPTLGNPLVRTYDWVAGSLDRLAARFDDAMRDSGDPAAFGARYGAAAAPAMKLMSLLSANVRVIAIFVACLVSSPQLFWWIEIAPLTLIALAAIVWHRRVEGTLAGGRSPRGRVANVAAPE